MKYSFKEAAASVQCTETDLKTEDDTHVMKKLVLHDRTNGQHWTQDTSVDMSMRAGKLH